MARLIGLLVLAFLLYQGYQHARPWLEQRLEAVGARSAATTGDEEQQLSIHCVDLARRANRTLADAMRRFAQPPVDQQTWTSTFIQVSGEIGTAEGACACGTAACDRAYAAVTELRDLSLSFDGVTRGASRGLGNPARAQERIEELLAEAAHLAGR